MRTTTSNTAHIAVDTKVKDLRDFLANVDQDGRITIRHSARDRSTGFDYSITVTS